MMPSAVALAIALLSAALMGLAIQRGGTCMVAAVDQIVRERKADKAAALGEAAIWVGGLVAIAAAAGWLDADAAAYPVTLGTATGGLLLGIGAYVNRACVFGSVARIGSGEWSYLATPLGFFLGCLVPLTVPAPTPSGGNAPVAGAPVLLLVLIFGGLAVYRIVGAARAPNLGAHLWHPHRATLLIAIAFVSAMLTVGAWAYTDALAAIARQMDAMISIRGIMVIALLAGAVAGGALAGKLRREAPQLGTALRCTAGGMLMGMGAALVPGSNDGLILLGLPELAPHAWVAVGVMTAAIIIAIKLETVTRRSGAA